MLPALHNHFGNRSKACGRWYLEYVGDADSELLAIELEADRVMKVANMDKGYAKFRVLERAGQLEGPQPFGAPVRHEFRARRLYGASA